MKKILILISSVLLCSTLFSQKYTYESDRFMTIDAFTKKESDWEMLKVVVTVESDIIKMDFGGQYKIYTTDSIKTSKGGSTMTFFAHNSASQIIFNITGWRRGEGMAMLFIQGNKEYLKMHISEIY